MRTTTPPRSLPLALPFALSLGLLASSCQEEQREQGSRLALPTEADAVAFMTRFFDRYLAADADGVVELLCEQGEADQQKARAFIERSQGPRSPYRVSSFQIRSVMPSWIGKEPHFRVEVSFPRARGPGEILHAYTLRVRDGCVVGFLGPPPTASDDAEPVDPPRPPADAPPVERPSPASDEDVIEL